MPDISLQRISQLAKNNEKRSRQEKCMGEYHGSIYSIVQGRRNRHIEDWRGIFDKYLGMLIKYLI